MEFKEVNLCNIGQEHICCAISASPEARACANAKKEWMCGAFADDYHFVKLDARGKAFIEFVPAERAWAPVDAPGWMYIDCFWVSGQFKGKGFATKLLEKAVENAKSQDKLGMVALGSDRKRPFLSDPGFYRYKGFVTADAAPPFYELLALPFSPKNKLPRFRNSVKNPEVSGAGVVVFYSDHCPHPSKYVPLLQKVVETQKVPFTAHRFTDREKAQAAPNPFPTYAMFFDNKFVTNEIFSEEKMRKFLENQKGK